VTEMPGWAAALMGAGIAGPHDPASVPAGPPRFEPAPVVLVGSRPPCVYLGLPIPDEGGGQAMRECASCRGSVRLKLWACLHPGHEGRPETTTRECLGCGDYEAGGAGQKAEGTAGTNEGINYWRGGS
jgi:hypothetical protein